MKVKRAKQELRIFIKDKKKHLGIEEKLQLSDKIFEQVEQQPQFRTAQTILAYWSMPDEVQTQDFILRWQHTKRFALPVVKGDELELRQFTGVDMLKTGSHFGILEPHMGEVVSLTELNLIIVPGVAFDRKGNRLGRGKAYYDKLLHNSVVYKMGVCFSVQLVDNVPVEPTDIPMDNVIWA